MERQIAKHLNWYYYGIMVTALLVLTFMYMSLMKGLFLPIDKMSKMGKIIQYIVILDALITIPGGLYGFKHLCTKLTIMPDDTPKKYTLYRRYATWRIILVGNAMIFGIIAFYLLGCYQSMIWVAAISAIALYFTKPTARKVQIELTPKDPNQETY